MRWRGRLGLEMGLLLSGCLAALVEEEARLHSPVSLRRGPPEGRSGYVHLGDLHTGHSHDAESEDGEKDQFMRVIPEERKPNSAVNSEDFIPQSQCCLTETNTKLTTPILTVALCL